MGTARGFGEIIVFAAVLVVVVVVIVVVETAIIYDVVSAQIAIGIFVVVVPWHTFVSHDPIIASPKGGVLLPMTVITMIARQEWGRCVLSHNGGGVFGRV